MTVILVLYNRKNSEYVMWFHSDSSKYASFYWTRLDAEITLFSVMEPQWSVLPLPKHLVVRILSKLAGDLAAKSPEIWDCIKKVCVSILHCIDFVRQDMFDVDDGNAHVLV
jgi:hypothetical protein